MILEEDPDVALLSRLKLQAYLREHHGLGISIPQLQAYLDNRQRVLQDLFAQRIRKPRRARLKVTAPPCSFQIDIIKVEGKNVLLIIDVVSRKMFAYKMSGGTINGHVLPAYKQFLESVPQVQSVSGDNFFSAKDFIAENTSRGIAVYTHVAYKDHYNRLGDRLGVIDRATRTIKSLITRYKKQHNRADWALALPRLVRMYNKTPHEALYWKMPGERKKVRLTPDAVFEDWDTSWEMYKKARLHNNEVLRKEASDIKRGDIVRVRLGKRMFEKEKQRYGDDLYIVNGVVGYKFSVTKLVPQVPLPLDQEEQDLDAAAAQAADMQAKEAAGVELAISNELSHMRLCRFEELLRVHHRQGIPFELVRQQLRRSQESNVQNAQQGQQEPGQSRRELRPRPARPQQPQQQQQQSGQRFNEKPVHKTKVISRRQERQYEKELYWPHYINGHRPEAATDHEGVEEYIIKWQGYPDDQDDTFELKAEVEKTMPRLVKHYWQWYNGNRVLEEAEEASRSQSKSQTQSQQQPSEVAQEQEQQQRKPRRRYLPGTYIPDYISGHHPESATDRKDVTEYKVRWKGHTDESIETKAHMEKEMRQLVDEYWKQQRQRKPRQSRQSMQGKEAVPAASSSPSHRPVAANNTANNMCAADFARDGIPTIVGHRTEDWREDESAATTHEQLSAVHGYYLVRWAKYNGPATEEPSAMFQQEQPALIDEYWRKAPRKMTPNEVVPKTIMGHYYDRETVAKRGKQAPEAGPGQAEACKKWMAAHKGAYFVKWAFRRDVGGTSRADDGLPTTVVLQKHMLDPDKKHMIQDPAGRRRRYEDLLKQYWEGRHTALAKPVRVMCEIRDSKASDHRYLIEYKPAPAPAQGQSTAGWSGTGVVYKSEKKASDMRAVISTWNKAHRM